MTQKYSYSPKKYSLGLDIGTSSIGWAVLDLDKERIHDLGVRIFEKPEDPQNGDSLAKPRRDARSARRRLKRRRQRLNNLKQFFIDQNILTRDRIEEVLSDKSEFNKLDVYALRSKALTEELFPKSYSRSCTKSPNDVDLSRIVKSRKSRKKKAVAYQKP